MTDPQADKAHRDLARLSREGETLGGTAMNAAAPPSDASQDDDIERLGKRIGRWLAVLSLPFALYIFGISAGWW
ncbi:MAG: hypothetical protein ACRCUE_08640 [Bosea sp. (in: a-proteobacteria)]